MIPKRFARRIAAVAAAMSIAILALPQAGMAQTIATPATPQPRQLTWADDYPTMADRAGNKNTQEPWTTSKAPSRHLTIHITDQGFDKTDYNVAHYESPLKEDITFVNDGSAVHNATILPGTSSGTGSMWSFSCFPSCPSNQKFKKAYFFNTGGLAPGQSVNGGFASAADYTIYSSVDCPPAQAQATPGFNCNPSVIHAKSYDSGSLNDMVSGSVLLPSSTDPSQCAVYVNPNDNAGPICWGNGVTLGRALGDPKNPVGGQGQTVTVTIDDVKGYDPAWIFIKPGTIVTWVNNGKRNHALTKNGPGTDAKNGYTPFESPAMGPGESWSYVPCSDTNVCKKDFGYNAVLELETLKWEQSGMPGGNQVSFYGEITTVIPK